MVLEATDRMAEQMAKMEASALNRLQASLETANSLQELTATGKAMEDWQKTELRTRAVELLQKNSNELGWEAKAKVFSELMVSKMDALRKAVDALELQIDDDLWPFPKYRELLYIS